MKRATSHDGQAEMNFFDVPSPPATEDGSLDLAREVREILAEVLARSAARGVDRFEVSALISRLADREVSKHMLDRYSSTASEDWRFPLEALPALTKATGDFALLELIAARCGCRVLRGEEAMLAEIGALMLQEKAAKSRLETIRKHVPQPVMQRLIDEALKRLGRG